MSLNLLSSLSFLKSRLGGGGPPSSSSPAPPGRIKTTATSLDLYGGVTESDLESSSSESEDEEEEGRDLEGRGEQDLEDVDQDLEDEDSSRYVHYTFLNGDLFLVIIVLFNISCLSYIVFARFLKNMYSPLYAGMYIETK
jgi:hypothetical protein